MSTIAANTKAITDSDVKQALNELDNELSRRYTYSAARQDKIDSLKAIANSYPEGTDRRLASLMELGDLYNGYLADSARVVSERAEQEARESDHPDRETRFMLKKLVNMTLTGFGPEAEQRFSAISTDRMPDSLKIEVFNAGRQLYDYQASFYPNSSESSKEWKAKSTNMLRKPLEILPYGSEEHTLRESECPVSHRTFSRSKNNSRQLFGKFDQQPDAGSHSRKHNGANI